MPLSSSYYSFLPRIKPQNRSIELTIKLSGNTVPNVPIWLLNSNNRITEHPKANLPTEFRDKNISTKYEKLYCRQRGGKKERKGLLK